MFTDMLRSWKESRPSASAVKYAPLWAQCRDGSALETEDVSSGVDSDEKGFLGRPPIRNRRHLFILFLSGLVCGSLLAVVGLWILHERRPPCSFGVQEFSPEMPLATVTFTEHPELFNRPSPETEAAWDALIPVGNGWVLIPDSNQYDLKPGVPVPELNVERYAVSMYHQLHCLRMIRKFYWKLVDSIAAGAQEEARREMEKQMHYQHVHHCFSYLAQGIQCSADLSIEWAIVEDDGSRFETDGWGMPHHQCKDPKAVEAWMNRVHAPKRVNGTHIH